MFLEILLVARNSDWVFKRLTWLFTLIFAGWYLNKNQSEDDHDLKVGMARSPSFPDWQKSMRIIFETESNKLTVESQRFAKQVSYPWNNHFPDQVLMKVKNTFSSLLSMLATFCCGASNTILYPLSLGQFTNSPRLASNSQSPAKSLFKKLEFETFELHEGCQTSKAYQLCTTFPWNNRQAIFLASIWSCLGKISVNGWVKNTRHHRIEIRCKYQACLCLRF